MAATFTADLSNDISKVRQLLGDTSTTDAEVQDETILAYMAAPFSLSLLRTAARLAYDLSAKYAKLADTTIDDQLTRFNHIYKQYITLAERLTKWAQAEEGSAPAATGYGAISVGGLDDCRGPLDDCPLWAYDCTRACC